MTRPRPDVAAQSAADTRVRRLGARSSLSHSRWSLWIGSLIAAGGAALLVTVAGSGGTAAQIPSAIQVGGQAQTVTSIASKPKVPAPTVTTPSTQPVAPPTTPTTTAISHRTTVIKPVSTVSDQRDPRGGDDSRDSNSGTTTSTTTTTTTTTIATTTSTSVVG